MKINKLLIATHNPGKFLEIKDRLSPLNIEFVSLKDLGITEDFEETGQTYEANAKGKAEFYFKLTKIPTLADDSGLSVDALNGEPGIRSRNWLGHRGSDQEILNYLMERMQDVPSGKRTAKFISVMVLYDGQDYITVRGEQPGIIGDKVIKGSLPGLPYDAVFYPDGCHKPFAQLSVEEKNAISHRGRAVDKIIKLLSATGGVNK